MVGVTVDSASSEITKMIWNDGWDDSGDAPLSSEERYEMTELEDILRNLGSNNNGSNPFLAKEVVSLADRYLSLWRRSQIKDQPDQVWINGVEM